MILSDWCIARPVGTTLLVIGLTIAGLLGYQMLPIASLPQVDYPTIVVSTNLPGASPTTMVEIVTTPLERQLGQIPGLQNMISNTGVGLSLITLQFRLDRSIDAAEQDVQAAINAAASLLPATLPAPPIYNKSNPADLPVLSLALMSNTLSQAQLSDYVDSVLIQKLSQISGVGLVAIGSGQKPAIRVQVNPETLANKGLTLEDLRQVLLLSNVNFPKGSLENSRQSILLATSDQLSSASDYLDLIVAWRNNSPIRLREVATVVRDIENRGFAAYADGKKAVVLTIQRQPGSNVIALVDRLYQRLTELKNHHAPWHGFANSW